MNNLQKHKYQTSVRLNGLLRANVNVSSPSDRAFLRLALSQKSSPNGMDGGGEADGQGDSAGDRARGEGDAEAQGEDGPEVASTSNGPADPSPPPPDKTLAKSELDKLMDEVAAARRHSSGRPVLSLSQQQQEEQSAAKKLSGGNKKKPVKRLKRAPKIKSESIYLADLFDLQ